MSKPTADRAGDAARERATRDDMEYRGFSALAMTTCPHGMPYPVGDSNPCPACAEAYRAEFTAQVAASSASVQAAEAELAANPPTEAELVSYLTVQCRQADSWIAKSDPEYPTLGMLRKLLPFRGVNATDFLTFRATL